MSELVHPVVNYKCSVYHFYMSLLGVCENTLCTDILVLLGFGTEKTCLHDRFSIDESTKVSVVLMSF